MRFRSSFNEMVTEAVVLSCDSRTLQAPSAIVMKLASVSLLIAPALRTDTFTESNVIVASHCDKDLVSSDRGRGMVPCNELLKPGAFKALYLFGSQTQRFELVGY